MKLCVLFDGLDVEIFGDDQNIEISGIALHSQDVLDNYLFISSTGEFVTQAKENGAIAILCLLYTSPSPRD